MRNKYVILLIISVELDKLTHFNSIFFLNWVIKLKVQIKSCQIGPYPFWPIAHMGFVQVGPNSLIGPKFLFNVFQVINLVIDIFNNSSIIFNILCF